MRMYATFAEVMSEVTRDLAELAVVYQSKTVQDMDVSGDAGYRTHELINYSYTLLNPGTAQTQATVSQETWDYISQEHRERIQGDLNPGESWKHDQEYWEPFIHNGKFSYTYSERMGGAHLEQLIADLVRDPNSRQLWLPVWDLEIDNLRRGGESRVPCSLGYHFMVRQGQLNLHYVMRSCDFIKHFQKDVILATMLQDHITGLTGMPQGSFTHTIFSLHAFDKDLEGVF